MTPPCTGPRTLLVCCATSGYKNAPEIGSNELEQKFDEEIVFHSSEANVDLTCYKANNCYLTFFDEHDTGNKNTD